MTFRKNSMTWKNFQNSVEGFLISAMGWQCLAEVAAANGYPDHIHRWRNDVERILFIDLSFFISSVKTKTVFDRRRAINELITEYDSAKTFQALLLMARKNLAARYLKRPRADHQELRIQAAVTTILASFRDLGFLRITISTSRSSAVIKFISRSTENPSRR